MSENKAHVRWVIRKDMPEILSIENACFSNPWSEDDFMRYLRQRNFIGMLAEQDDHIMGFMIYELRKASLRIINFAVRPESRRRGIGTAMIRKLESKLSPQRRSTISLEIRETNLNAQLFFRKMGFKAVSIFQNFYEDTLEAAYAFRYQFDQSSLCISRQGEG